jgi:hypothetical protein
VQVFKPFDLHWYAKTAQAAAADAHHLKKAT